MYKVILADDEDRILTGLENLIDWEELHLRIAGRAGNGGDALELIGQTGAEILITDIKMPGLDGIGLIRRARELSPGIRCLVLSGYDDFPLVREAMRCGAENYLLKPVDREEFLQSLKEIVLTLEAEESLPALRWSGRRLLLNNLMNRMVRNDISLKEFRRKMEFLQVDIYDCAFALTVFSRPAGLPGRADEDLAVYEGLADLLEKSRRGLVFRDSAGRPAVLFFINGQRDQAEMEAILRSFLAGMDSPWIAVSGDVVSSYRDLHLSYSQALEGLSLVRFLPPDPLSSYRPLLAETDRIRRASRSVLDRLLQRRNRSGSDLPAGTVLASLPAEFRESRNMKLFCGILAGEIFRSAEETEILSAALFLLQREEWEEGVTALLAAADERRAGERDTGYSPLVEKLTSYVEDNYRDYDISLKILAAKLNVSPEHAGRMFKKDTGRFFSDFLSEIRIRHACEMLKGTSLPANDIALKAGFMNQNYFYTKFKKYTGMNPTEYRSSAGTGGRRGPERPEGSFF